MAAHAVSWSVYLLECRGGRIYTGIAIDVEARIRQHGRGRGARFTRAHPPARLLASFGYPDRGSALRAEAAIKRLRAAAKRALAAGLRPPPAAVMAGRDQQSASSPLPPSTRASSAAGGAIE